MRKNCRNHQYQGFVRLLLCLYLYLLIATSSVPIVIGYFIANSFIDPHNRIVTINHNIRRYHISFAIQRRRTRNSIAYSDVDLLMSRRNSKTNGLVPKKLSIPKKRKCDDDDDDDHKEDDDEYHTNNNKVKASPNVNTTSNAKKVSKNKVLMASDNNLLQSFIQHDSLDFHKFTREEAYHIRNALLEWYRKYRRKLPWRGDAPPWNGSVKDFSKNVILTQQKQQQQQNDVEIIPEEIISGGSKKSINQRSTKRAKMVQTLLKPKETKSITPNSSNNNYHRTYPITPYGIWVSEVMLQQTRVEAVIDYWMKWMNLFPTIKALSNATEDEVNTAWVGLGYYRRARFLHTASKEIINNPKIYNGKLPETVDELLKLPGIGMYTASAIASIAFNQQVPVVDGNVCRMLCRLRCIAQHTKAPVLTNKYGWILAQQIIDATSLDNTSSSDCQESCCAGEVNQAIMELGATYCSPAGTGIEDNDPLRDYYWSTRLGEMIYKTDLTDLSNMISKIEARRQNSRSKNTTCPLCDTNGIMDVIDNLSEMNSQLLRKNNTVGKSSSTTTHCKIDTARINGHSVFPCPAPKLNPRKEVLVVATISCTLPDSGEKAWLLVKRPNKGLLAGQWEFPSILVWSSIDGHVLNNSSSNTNNSTNQKNHKTIIKKKTNNTKVKTTSDDEIPLISKGDQLNALQILIKGLVHSNGIETKKLDSWILSPFVNDRKRSSERFVPINDHYIEHIFSHVRHSMWIMSYNTDNNHPIHTESSSMKKKNGTEKINYLPEEWTDSNDRVVRWMRQSEIKSVGVTAGIGKVFKALEHHKEDKTHKLSQKKKRSS